MRRGPESELAEISAWRRAYAQMGLKPTQYRSAAEALLRRFRRGEELPRLHPLVDLCNAISLAFALPVAVFDLAGSRATWRSAMPEVTSSTWRSMEPSRLRSRAK